MAPQNVCCLLLQISSQRKQHWKRIPDAISSGSMPSKVPSHHTAATEDCQKELNLFCLQEMRQVPANEGNRKSKETRNRCYAIPVASSRTVESVSKFTP